MPGTYFLNIYNKHHH